MCYIEKCCFVLPLRIGCIIIGLTTFVLSLVFAILALLLLVLEESHIEEGCVYVKAITGLILNSSSLKIVLSLYVILLILFLVFSLALLYGIWKNRTNFVLSYFFYGTFVAFAHTLTSLLLLIQGHWVMALEVVTVCMLYIHCLVTVYSAYELMHRYKTLNSRSTEELLGAFIGQDENPTLRLEY